MSVRSRLARFTSVLLPAVVIATTLGSVAVVTTLDASPAAAESLPPYPGISFPDGAFNSRCAQMSLSGGPTVVHVGQEISASAGPPADECGGPAKGVSWSWTLPQVGKIVSGCGPKASSCVVRAEFPTSDWEQVCIDGG